jgi:hypothetical protein
MSYELLSWLARLSMHHREKLKFSLVFMLHSYTHIKSGRREYVLRTKSFM